MAKQVRVGVIGTSPYTEMMHLRSLSSHPQVVIVALCGRMLERATALADAFGVPQVFTDYRQLIARSGADAVVVATPEDQHYAMVMAALEAGMHVVCEKPLAMSAEQARSMLEQAAARGVTHMVHFTFRWVPEFRYLHHLVADRFIGRCYHCRLSSIGGFGRDGAYAWRFDRRHGNGVLGDVASHLIDLARWYVGDIASVSAHLAALVERPGPNGAPLDAANDAALLAVEFTHGAHGTIHVSSVAHVGRDRHVWSVALYGELGSLELVFGGGETQLRGIRYDEHDWRTLHVPAEFWTGIDRSRPAEWRLRDTFVSQQAGDRAFIDAIVEQRDAVPSFYDGYCVQQVIDAAMASHLDATWVHLEQSASAAALDPQHRQGEGL